MYPVLGFIVLFLCGLCNAPAFTGADFEAHCARLKQKTPRGFTIVIQKPFVVISDEPRAVVKLRSERTIKWAVDMLKQDYFKKDPGEIIDIWLFKDNKSYYKYSKKIFSTEPTTPYGFYLEKEKALIMNIETGGGTLVHEIVHPFIRANFPECPPWLNEGLASLYEQCGERNGHIYGYTNWRLSGLQSAIRENLVPSFEDLCSMDEDGFYLKDRGTNYAQARYLCYYLQEQGLLVKFYHEFYDHRTEDPTGYQIVKRILGVEDMDSFKKTWEQYILALTFP